MKADIEIKSTIRLIPKFKSNNQGTKFSFKLYWLCFDLQIDNY
jgi:hypothetical protein